MACMRERSNEKRSLCFERWVHRFNAAVLSFDNAKPHSVRHAFRHGRPSASSGCHRACLANRHGGSDERREESAHPPCDTWHLLYICVRFEYICAYQETSYRRPVTYTMV